MAKIEIGTKIKIKPLVYEIEIIKLSQEVPKKQESDFIEWLNRQVTSLNFIPGYNQKPYIYNDNEKDWINVIFKVKSAGS